MNHRKGLGVLLGLSALATSSCAPRGTTHTVDFQESSGDIASRGYRVESLPIVYKDGTLDALPIIPLNEGEQLVLSSGTVLDEDTTVRGYGVLESGRREETQKDHTTIDALDGRWGLVNVYRMNENDSFMTINTGENAMPSKLIVSSEPLEQRIVPNPNGIVQIREVAPFSIPAHYVELPDGKKYAVFITEDGSIVKENNNGIDIVYRNLTTVLMSDIESVNGQPRLFRTTIERNGRMDTVNYIKGNQYMPVSIGSIRPAQIPMRAPEPAQISAPNVPRSYGTVPLVENPVIPLIEE